MRAAIVGAGLAGLSICHFLLQAGWKKIDVYDERGVGGGASQIAAGLFHPFLGRSAHPANLFEECTESAHELLRVAQNAAPSPVILSKGLIRPALDDRMRKILQQRSRQYPDLAQWKDSLPGLPHFGGLFFPQGLVIDCKAYLQGLWRSCPQAFCRLIIKKIDHLEELACYDVAFIASGKGCMQLEDIQDRGLHLVKGQLLHMQWPSGNDLPFAICGHPYIVKSIHDNTCIIGATFEHHWQTELSCQETAAKLLLDKAYKLVPELKKSPILSCQSAFRVMTKTKTTPYFAPHKSQKNCFVYTGLGSRGLLQHVYYARTFIEKMKQKNLLYGN